MSFDDFFSCQICYEQAVPAVACDNGHFVCHRCFCSIGTPVCPTCKSTLQERRGYNRMMDLLGKILPCPFTEEGCGQQCSASSMSSHLKRCAHRNIACHLTTQCEGSAKEYSRELLFKHWLSDHGLEELQIETSTLAYNGVTPDGRQTLNFAINPEQFAGDGASVVKKIKLGDCHLFFRAIGVGTFLSMWVFSSEVIPSTNGTKYSIQVFGKDPIDESIVGFLAKQIKVANLREHGALDVAKKINSLVVPRVITNYPCRVQIILE